MTVAEWLARLGVDPEAVAWARAYGRAWDRAWAECPRGDWLLTIAARMTTEPTALVRAASACARLGLDYVPGEEARALGERALDGAESWALAHGSTAPLSAFATDLEREAATAPDAAASTALRAASAACRVAIDADAAPLAASLAVEAAVMATGDCAALSALTYMQRKTAEAVRTHVARQLVKGPHGRC